MKGFLFIEDYYGAMAVSIILLLILGFQLPTLLLVSINFIAAYVIGSRGRKRKNKNIEENKKKQEKNKKMILMREKKERELIKAQREQSQKRIKQSIGNKDVNF